MIIACVTSQESCERLIESAAEFARQLDSPLKVVSVQPISARSNGKGLASPELEHLYEVSKEYHAEMNVYFNGDPIQAITNVIDESADPVEAIICGQPGMKGSNDFIQRLNEAVPDLDIYILSTSGIMLPLALETLSLG